MQGQFVSDLSRPWDTYDAYLFDIDGTLLSSEDAVHYFAFCDALAFLSGRPLNLDGVVAHGNTDIGILRDALRFANVPATSWRPLLQDACARMGNFVAKRKDDLSVRLLPGVREVLAYLSQRGAVLGVATGNLEVIGRLKLEAAGILPFFTIGSYSDGLEVREDVFRRALLSAPRQDGKILATCILGDTPEDIRSARINRTECLAVATGIYSYEELLQEGPTACCGSFKDLLVAVDSSEI